MHRFLRSGGIALAVTGALAIPVATAQGTPQSHHAAMHVPARAGHTPAVRVDVRTTKNGLTRSRSGFRPGMTVFHVHRGASGGGVEVVRLKGDYTIKDLQDDVPQIFGGDTKVIRRVDRHVVFIGGAQARHGTVNAFGARLEKAGRYYVYNVDQNVYTTLRVQGTFQKRYLPRTRGVVTYAGDNTFVNHGRLRHRGWLREVNRTDEPHFTDLLSVKPGTTRRQVQRYFDNGANGQPRWARPYYREALVLSPGRTMTWYADARRGKYVEACWWPSDEDGMPHALMGMWNLTRLH